MPRKQTRRALRNRLDLAWSRLIRSRGFCERCGRGGGYVLHAHHTIGRRNLRLRWDARNGVCLCFLCHAWAGDNPDEQTAWREVYRPEDWDYCKRVKNEITHYSDTDLIDMLQDLEGSLEREAA